MRTIRLLLPLVVIASPLAAQKSTPRLEIGVDASYWRIGTGTASSDAPTRPGGTVRAAVVLPTHLPATLGLSATYAREDGVEPGILAFSSEYAQRLFSDPVAAMNLFIAGGAGMMRYASGEQEAIIDACLDTPGCMYEGKSQDGEWRTVLTASLGMDVQLVRGLLLQPMVGVVKPFGGPEGSGGREAVLRTSIGLAWRP